MSSRKRKRSLSEAKIDPNHLQKQHLLDFILLHRHLNTIKKGVLTVSAYANFYPVCYKEKGVIKGLDVDIINAFAAHCGLKVKYIEKNSFNDIWLDPPHRKSDLSIGGIGISQARTTPHTSWTIPYFYVLRTLVYNKKDPIHKFPQDVKDVVKGTVGSTGWLDAVKRLKAVHKLNLLKPGSTDQKDMEELEHDKIQGLMRGSFVGKAIVKKHHELGMVPPWQIDPSLVSSDGECFAYPCHIQSGVSVLLSSFLTGAMFSGDLAQLVHKYKLE